MGVVNGKMHLGSFFNGNFEMGSRDGWTVGTSEIFSGDSNDDIEGSNFSLKTSSRWSSSGWNNLLFKKISKQKNISIDKLELLYPNGYIDMIKFMFLNMNSYWKT